MERGFTLLEMLIVMVIIGVMTTTLTLSMAPDTPRRVQDEAYRFARVLEQAVDADEMGDTLGLDWQPDGYAFNRLDASSGRWRTVNDEFFAARRWPDGMRGQSVRVPQGKGPWLLWRDNQSPPLSLRLDSASRRFDLMLSPLGRVTVKEADAK
jgi:general secretion pathway protein H